MKKKCVVCHKARGKRGCMQYEMASVCPKCCAQIRNASCEACSYFPALKRYDENKNRKSGEKQFTAEINPELDRIVDAALALLERKKVKKAEKLLSDLRSRHPNYHMVQYGLGVLCAFERQYDDAITHFKKAVDIFPYLIEAYFNLGVAYKEKFDLSNMLKYLQKAMSLSEPGDDIHRLAKEMLEGVEKAVAGSEKTDLDTYLKAQEQFNNGVELMEKGQYEKAIHAFRASERICTGPPSLYGNIGLCHAKLGRKIEAIEAFEKALERDPEYELAIVNKKMVELLSREDMEDLGMRVTEYYKEFPMKGKSYIHHVQEQLEEDSK